MNTKIWIIAGLLLISGFAHSEEPDNRFCVQFFHKPNDRLGNQLAYRLKEELAKSSNLRLMDTCFMKVLLDTMNSSPDSNDSRQVSTTYDVIILLEDPRTSVDAYEASYIGYVGSDRVAEAAANLMVSIDADLPTVRKHWEKWLLESMETLRKKMEAEAAANKKK